MRTSLRSMFLSTALIPLLAVPAYAQETPVSASQPVPATTPSATETSIPGQEQSVDTQADDTLGDIVVTAQRRSERLQSIPAAISAFSGEQMRSLGIESTKDLTRITPGLNMTQSIAWAQPTIRGIGTRGVGAGDESVVPIYVDGVYQMFLMSLFNDLNSVERIEVLKGPQGALLGRNATGGAINIITKTPGAGTHGDFSLSYGRFNDTIAKGYLAVGNDKIAADIAAIYSYGDGFIKDTLRNVSFGGRENYAVRSKISWHATPNLDLTLTGSIGRNNDSYGVAFRPIDGNTQGARIPGNLIESRPYQVALTDTPFSRAKQRSISLTGAYRGDGYEITALSGYQFNSSDFQNDPDATPAKIGVSILQQYAKTSYNEAYITTDASRPFSIVAGGVYYYNKAGYYTLYQESRSVSLTGVLGTPSIANLKPFNSTNSYAGYVQGTYRFTDTLSLTGGGRYTIDKRAFQSTLPTGVVLTNSNLVRKFTPTATLQFQPSADLNVYAKAGQAFKAGIVNNAGQTVLTAIYVRPETVTQYEVGVKTAINPAIRLNIAAYYTNYKDLQVSARDPINPGLALLQNAGAGRIYGTEVELFLRPVQNLNIQANMSLMSATYRDFPLAQVFIPNTSVLPTDLCTMGTGVRTGGNRAAFCNASGKTLARTPTLQLNLNGSYMIPLASGGQVLLSGGVSHQGKSYWDTYNLVPEKAYTLIDARATYKFGLDNRHSFAIWGRNLGNVRYNVTTNVSATNTAEADARPRTYGFEVRTTF